MKCNCCEQELDLRFGICFRCADAESVIADGTNMFDEPVPKLEGYSESMAKLKAILEIYGVLRRQ